MEHWSDGVNMYDPTWSSWRWGSWDRGSTNEVWACQCGIGMEVAQFEEILTNPSVVWCAMVDFLNGRSINNSLIPSNVPASSARKPLLHPRIGPQSIKLTFSAASPKGGSRNASSLHAMRISSLYISSRSASSTKNPNLCACRIRCRVETKVEA